MEVFNNLSREEVDLACNWFQGRLEKVIAANGDFIEEIYSLIIYLVSKYVFMREIKK